MAVIGSPTNGMIIIYSYISSLADKVLDDFQITTPSSTTNGVIIICSYVSPLTNKVLNDFQLAVFSGFE
jgi:hypothetical protein